MISLNENGIGGFKEAVFMISGQGAYSRLKYESGVHRVQRVPETESGGRIHTSKMCIRDSTGVILFNTNYSRCVIM